MLSASLLFRIVYTTFYFLLYFILLVLLVISPADIIYQSLHNDPKTFFVVVLSVAYFVTTTIVVFVYTTRLYINRSVLASIPKSWIPIDKGDVRSTVRKMIVASMSRSAAIAFDARPRVLPPAIAAAAMAYEDRRGEQQPSGDEGLIGSSGLGGSGADEEKTGREDKRFSFRLPHLKRMPTVEDELGINLPPHKPVWGEIEHSGWGSPLSPDFPDLQYGTVVSELPNLIEAKALTLAPAADPATASPPGSVLADEQQPSPLLDPDAVALLQRGNLALRDYLAGLTELGVLPPSQAAAEFLASYEHARFSTRPVSARRFRELMQLFADLLRSMSPLDPAILDPRGEEGDGDEGFPPPGGRRPEYSSDIDNDCPAATTASSNPTTPPSSGGGAGRRPSPPFDSSSPVPPQGQRQWAATAAQAQERRPLPSRGSSPAPSARSARTASTTGSGSSSGGSQIRRRRPRRPVLRTSSANTWQAYRTAPTTPKSRRTVNTTASATGPADAAGVVAAQPGPGAAGHSPSSTGFFPGPPYRGGGSPYGASGSSVASSFAHTRHPYPISRASTGSLRSMASSGSVVRLRDR